MPDPQPKYSNLEFPIGINDSNSDDRAQGFISFQVIQNQRANVGNEEKVITVAKDSPIHMYIPNGLTFTDGVAYGPFDLGLVGEAALRATRAGGEFSDTVTELKNLLNNPGQSADALTWMAGNVLSSTLPTAIGTAIGAAFKNKGAGAAIGSLIDTSKITNGYALATQRTMNPNTKALLERINLRQFSFQFNMIPTSKKEAEMIRAIVETFRTELYPDTVNIGDYPALLRYPNKFNIMVVPNGDPENKHAVKFKPAFLQSVSTSYNPTSTTYFEDGAPVETVMTLNFIEEGTMTKKDVAGGY